MAASKPTITGLPQGFPADAPPFWPSSAQQKQRATIPKAGTVRFSNMTWDERKLHVQQTKKERRRTAPQPKTITIADFLPPEDVSPSVVPKKIFTPNYSLLPSSSTSDHLTRYFHPLLQNQRIALSSAHLPYNAKSVSKLCISVVGPETAQNFGPKEQTGTVLYQPEFPPKMAVKFHLEASVTRYLNIYFAKVGSPNN